MIPIMISRELVKEHIEKGYYPAAFVEAVIPWLVSEVERLDAALGRAAEFLATELRCCPEETCGLPVEGRQCAECNRGEGIEDWAFCWKAYFLKGDTNVS